MASSNAMLKAWEAKAPCKLYSTDPIELENTIIKIYGYGFGHDPSGSDDRYNLGIATTFGEILPRGVSKILDDAHLKAADTKLFCDLGMGNGKLAMQAFLSYQNLKTVIGVELVRPRYLTGVKALRELHKNIAGSTFTETAPVAGSTGAKATLVTSCGRKLEFRHDNLLNQTDCFEAGVVIMEVIIPNETCSQIHNFLNRFKVGSRLLTYQTMLSYYSATSPWQTFAQYDTYAASWGQIHFHLSKKVC